MAPQEATHHLYIDDSGTKEYAANPASYGSGNTRYFVFGGVLIEKQAARLLVPRIHEIKRVIFGTHAVELKSNWLRMPTERRRHYLEPFKVSEEDITGFVDAYYDVLLSAEFKFIAGVVDKEHMQAKYPQPWYPPAVAYELVLQRAEDELRGRGTFSVSVDMMSGATPKRNQYADNLRAQHDRMLKTGSSLLRAFEFKSLVGPLRFQDSAHSDLIQVADIAAYNVFRQFFDHGDAWETLGLPSLPMYEHFARLSRKFRTDAQGRLQGYGIAKMPLVQRVHWTLRRPAE